MTIAAEVMTTGELRPHLEFCGYQGSLLRSDYPYRGEQVRLVGFRDQTYDARSACVAAIDARAKGGKALGETVGTYRGLGTPVMFVCGKGELQWWIINTQGVKHRETISRKQLEGFFRAHKDEFSPESIYRAKTIGRLRTHQQLDFVDIGLMPFVEHQMGSKLADLIVRMINKLYSERGKPRMTGALGQWLFQTAFWLVGAKILKDKKVREFDTVDLQDVSAVFERIRHHYSAEQEPRCSSQVEKRAVESAAAVVKGFASVSNLTIESLAYVYENALVTKKTREVMGTHATPSYLVDYMVWQLAPWIDEIPPAERVVLEPTCGHAPFLASAARLLRELIDEEDPAKRHQYLSERLIGFEKDSFAREVARLSLTLADVPNPNGWQLQLADVYRGEALSRAASKATILLCNPPFQNFRPAEQGFYRAQGTRLHCFNKSAEVIWRTLPHMPAGSVFGVIVPQGFLQNPRLANLRKFILEHFELAEICALPENVFELARHKSALLMGRRLKVAGRRSVMGRVVRFRRVQKWDLDAFKENYRGVTEKVPQGTFYVPSAYHFHLQLLRNIWEYCEEFPRLSSVSDLAKGLEYKGKELPPNWTTRSKHRFAGAVLGYAKFEKGIKLTETPQAEYMSLDPAVIRRPGLGAEFGKGQVLVNYARVSLGPWRLKALIDRAGHPVSSRYIVTRPKTREWSLEALWGLLNSPFANAYVYCHSVERDNLVGTVRKVPIPACEVDSVRNLTSLVAQHFEHVASERESLWSKEHRERAHRDMLAIDAEVMRLYDLPPRLERQLLDFFAGWKRAGVPFDFRRYFAADFESCIPLHEYLSQEYQRSTIGFADEWVKKHRSPEVNAVLRKAVEAFEED